MRSKNKRSGVLQFTPIFVVCYVLHRPASRVIHRMQLYCVRCNRAPFNGRRKSAFCIQLNVTKGVWLKVCYDPGRALDGRAQRPCLLQQQPPTQSSATRAESGGSHVAWPPHVTKWCQDAITVRALLARDQAVKAGLKSHLGILSPLSSVQRVAHTSLANERRTH